jgi:hypothetical protein
LGVLVPQEITSHLPASQESANPKLSLGGLFSLLAALAILESSRGGAGEVDDEAGAADEELIAVG